MPVPPPPTQILPMALAIQIVEPSILGNSNHKRPVVAPKPTNFELLVTKDYQEHKSRLQVFLLTRLNTLGLTRMP